MKVLLGVAGCLLLSMAVASENEGEEELERQKENGVEENVGDLFMSEVAASPLML